MTDSELTFAERQSTRAKISRWSFQNEYHYGDFRGDVNGLLRHGYDVFLHYANFGIRTVAFRLPMGMPFPKRLWSRYIGTGALRWEKDRKGNAGIVLLSPHHDAGEIEELWDVDGKKCREARTEDGLSDRCYEYGFPLEAPESSLSRKESLTTAGIALTSPCAAAAHKHWFASRPLHLTKQPAEFTIAI